MAESINKKTLGSVMANLLMAENLSGNVVIENDIDESIGQQLSITKVIAEHAILVDHSCFEAQATALVLILYLTPHASHKAEKIPFILPNNMLTPKHVKVVFLMCTQGALLNASFLRALISAAQIEAQYLPILAEESFRFPTKEFIEENDATIAHLTDQHEALLTLILSVFKSIAVVFQPEQYSSTDEILEVKALQICERMLNTNSGCRLEKLSIAADFTMLELRRVSVDLARLTSIRLGADANYHGDNVDAYDDEHYDDFFEITTVHSKHDDDYDDLFEI